jgi:hypothetical protein
MKTSPNLAFHPQRPRQTDESGVALIMVLGVLAASMLLIAHLMTVSEILSKEALVTVRKSELRYQAESAADISYWMYLTDRRLFSNRKLGRTEADELREDKDYPPWMQDRRPHEFDDGQVVTYLSSGADGFDYRFPERLKNTLDSDSSDYNDLVDEFADILTDYKDSDDLRQLNGMEKGDYEALGFPTLPRNGAPQYRAEIYWLPGWQEVVPGEIALIPPKGVTFNSQEQKPSFFSASPNLLYSRLDVNEDEMNSILEARLQWETEGASLQDNLSTELYSKINSACNFTESDIVLITSAAYSPDKEFRTVLRFYRIADADSQNFNSDRHKQTLMLLETSRE